MSPRGRHEKERSRRLPVGIRTRITIAVPVGALLVVGVMNGFAAEKGPGSTPSSEIVATSESPRQYSFKGYGYTRNQSYDVKVNGLWCADTQTTFDGEFDSDITPCVLRSHKKIVRAILVQKGQIVSTAALDIAALD
jgi:hypothetical protein